LGPQVGPGVSSVGGGGGGVCLPARQSQASTQSLPKKSNSPSAGHKGRDRQENKLRNSKMLQERMSRGTRRDTERNREQESKSWETGTRPFRRKVGAQNRDTLKGYKGGRVVDVLN